MAADDKVDGGYRVYEDPDDAALHLYRVPDLLNKQDFIDYMDDVYNATVTITQN